MSEDLAFPEKAWTSEDCVWAPGLPISIINKKKSSYPAPEFSFTSWLNSTVKVTKANDRRREIIT
jgi:hypothetical protein